MMHFVYYSLHICVHTVYRTNGYDGSQPDDHTETPHTSQKNFSLGNVPEQGILYVEYDGHQPISCDEQHGKEIQTLQYDFDKGQIDFHMDD